MMRTSRGILFLKRFVLAALVIAGFVSVSAYASRLHSFGETLAQRVYCTVHAAEKRCQSIQPIVLTETENPAGAVLAETDSVASVPLTEPGVGINTPSPVYTTQSTTDQETKDFLLAYLGISSAMLELIESQKDYLNDRIRGQASRTNDSTNERLSELATLDTGEEGQVLLVQSGVPTWVATSTLGISGGGGSTFTALTDTQNSFTANRIPFTNSGATALTDSANFVFNGTNLGVGSTSPTAKLTIQGAAGQTADLFVIASSTGSQFLTVTADGSIGIGTTTPSELLHIASGNILIEDNQYLKFGTNADALFSYSSTDDQLEVTGGIASYFSGRVSDPKLMSEVYDGDGEFSRLSGPTGVAVSGDYAYIASGTDDSLTIIDISDPADPALVSEVYDGDGEFSRLNSAFDVVVQGRYAYVTSFLDDSLTIMDISDPTDPVLMSEVSNGDGEFTKMNDAYGLFVAGNYAYVVALGSHALNIIDISDPTDPDLMSAVYFGDGEFTRLLGASNVFVSGNYAYVTSLSQSALTIMDISDPTDPVLMSEVYNGDGEFSHLSGLRDVNVSGSYAYVVGSGGFTIMDISDPTDPVLMSEVYDGDGEFSRLSGPFSLSISGDYAYITSNTDDSLTIIDISDPADPALVSEVYDGDGEFSRLDAAWGSVVSGGYAYVVGSEGFTTIDISGITTPSIYAGDVRAGNAYIDNRLTIGGDVSIKGGVAALNAFLAGDLGTAGRVRFSTFGAGTLQTDASGNVSVSSDERLKVIEGFYTATSSIERILGLAPIQYHWASTTGFDTTTLYTGFSAQNVQEFIPEAVGEDPHGFLTLSDRPILATVVNAIKELWERVTGNTERIEELEEEVALLKKELQSDTKQNSSDTQNDNSTQSDDANDQEDDVTADDESNGEEVIEEESGSEEGVVEEDEVETEETVAEETESDSETDVPVETEEDVVAESTDDTVGETVEEPTA